MVLPMMNTQAAFRASKDLSFVMITNDTRDYVPKSAEKAAFCNKSDMWYGDVAPSTNEEAPVEHQIRRIRKYCKSKQEVNAREVKSTMKEMVLIKLRTVLRNCWTRFWGLSYRTGKEASTQSLVELLSTVCWNCYAKMQYTRRWTHISQNFPTLQKLLKGF